MAVQDLKGGENYVFAYERNGQEYVLRIGHSFHRTQDLVRAEIDWLNHLVGHGLPVASPVRSLTGKRTEVVHQGSEEGYFVAVAFERAPGEDLGGGSRAKERWWNAELFEQWGALMGRMHRIARDYRVPGGAPRRPHWDEWPMLDFARWIPNDQGTVLAYGADLKKRLGALPRDPDGYGMIHGDFTQINFAVDRGALTLFDFDRCEYAWFVGDIAIALFWAVRDTQQASPGFASLFLKHLMRGYRGEHDLSARWLEAVPDFLRLEQLCEYALAYRRLGGARPENDHLHYLLSLRGAIERDRFVIPLDLHTLRSILGSA